MSDSVPPEFHIEKSYVFQTYIADFEHQSNLYAHPRISISFVKMSLSALYLGVTLEFRYLEESAIGLVIELNCIELQKQVECNQWL